MARDHGPSVKDDETYEALRAGGASPQKAARIANARAAGTLKPRGDALDARTKDDLMHEARRIGIAGRSKMTKAELVRAIRHG